MTNEPISTFSCEFQVWSVEKGAYQTNRSTVLGNGQPIFLGPITINFQKDPPFTDPTNHGPILFFQRPPDMEKLPHPMTISSQRPGRPAQQEIIGKTIMVRQPSFFFSDLNVLENTTIYDGIVSDTSHPDAIKITPISSVGENGTRLS